MGLTEFLATYITGFIDQVGYTGVFVLMTMESMVFPVPSEAVMPFAGFLIAEGGFTFTSVIFFSTLGSITGSLISYCLGAYGGNPFVDKFGKYFLLNRDDLAFTARFFHKYGSLTIFISRFIPVVRHLISIPAGMGRMRLAPFCLFTVVGAGLWNAFLAWAGFFLKQNWETVMRYSKVADILVIILLAGVVVLFIYKHIRK